MSSSAAQPASAAADRARPVVAVLIPSRNEGPLIADTLDALAAQDFDGDLRVYVCVNGDSKGTFAIVEQARERLADRVRIEARELDKGSKPIALNTADEMAGDADFRIYLDADTKLTSNAVRALVAVLDSEEPRVAAPSKRLDPGPSWIVNLCARSWMRLPWVQDEVPGSGVVAVNRAGRTRWQQYPDVVADDGYTAWQFAPEERFIAREAASLLEFPDTVRGMFAAMSRWHSGGQQLDASPHKPPYGPAWQTGRRLRSMLHPGVFVAAVITRIARVASNWFGPKTEAASWSTR